MSRRQERVSKADLSELVKVSADLERQTVRHLKQSELDEVTGASITGPVWDGGMGTAGMWTPPDQL